MTPLKQEYIQSICPHCTRPVISQPTNLPFRLLSLTQGQVAIVDASDFVWLSQWNWFARIEKQHTYYAYRTVYGENRVQSTIAMHRLVVGVEAGNPLVVDHINGDGLDNRRVNLRLCESAQNTQNSRMYRNNTSGFKGVYLRQGKWAARISVGGKRIELGSFDNPDDAGEAYTKAAKIHHGEFARSL